MMATIKDVAREAGVAVLYRVVLRSMAPRM